MNKIVAMAAKDIHILFRDKLGFFFTVFFPLMMAIFFGAMFAGLSRGPANIPIALVDQDRTAASERFIERLGQASGLAVEQIPGEEALEQVRRGRTAVLVTLTPGFGAALDNPFVTTPEVEMTVDPTQFAVAGMVPGRPAGGGRGRAAGPDVGSGPSGRREQPEQPVLRESAALRRPRPDADVPRPVAARFVADRRNGSGRRDRRKPGLLRPTTRDRADGSPGRAPGSDELLCHILRAGDALDADRRLGVLQHVDRHRTESRHADATARGADHGPSPPRSQGAGLPRRDPVHELRR